MNDDWRPCRDRSLILRLHREQNRGLYELLGQYCRIRPDDLGHRSVRTWVHRSGAQVDGFAIGLTTRNELCLVALWCRCTGLADRTVRSWSADDERLLTRTRSWIRSLRGRATLPVIIRVESENAFGTLLAKRFAWTLEATLLLATRPTTGFPWIPTPPGYCLRSYERRDEEAFARIHRDAFHQGATAEAYRRWVRQRNCETFSATRDGEVVGLMIAEMRRGGEIGDFNLAVSSQHRGRGVGTALLAAGVRSLRRRGTAKVVADHWATNAPAVSLYRKYGFRVERVYSYYRVASLRRDGPVKRDSG